MSKSYRCRVKVDLRERVAARDAVAYEIDIGRILGKKAEAALLRKALLDLGGEEQDGKVVLEVEGVRVTVDPETGEAQASVEDEGDVRRHVDEERKVFNVRDDEAAAKEKAQADAEKEAKVSLEQEKAALQKTLDDKVRDTLKAAGPAIVRRLRVARGETEKAALEEKARQLGTVVSKRETEDPKRGDRSLVIEIELPD
jgi:hypothetical protein